MVDALRRAHGIVGADGVVIDLHPSAARAVLEVGDRTAGFVEAGDAPLRHAAAGVALAAAIDQGLFALEHSVVFAFHTYGDTVEELRDYVARYWRNGRIDEGTVDGAREMLRHAPGTKPRVREGVYATRLRAIGAPTR